MFFNPGGGGGLTPPPDILVCVIYLMLRVGRESDEFLIKTGEIGLRRPENGLLGGENERHGEGAGYRDHYRGIRTHPRSRDGRGNGSSVTSVCRHPCAHSASLVPAKEAAAARFIARNTLHVRTRYIIRITHDAVVARRRLSA